MSTVSVAVVSSMISEAEEAPFPVMIVEPVLSAVEWDGAERRKPAPMVICTTLHPLLR